jgi:hypothetical protein
MSTSVKDYHYTFGALKKVTIITLIGAFILNGILVYYILSSKETQAKRVYVVTDSGTFPAILQETRKVSVYEARNHVRTFFSTLFAHDATNYKERVEAGLALIDKQSGQRIVNDFNKGEVYENYVRLGTYTTLEMDSVVIDVSTRPISGRAYARQTIFLGEESKAYPIGAKFELIETYRSDNNPYGLLIQKFDFIPYRMPQAGE